MNKVYCLIETNEGTKQVKVPEVGGFPTVLNHINYAFLTEELETTHGESIDIGSVIAIKIYKSEGI